MAATGRAGTGSFLAVVLGAAVLAARPFAMAQGPTAHSGDETVRPEVVISATRQADAVITAKVVKALEDDPYVYVGHISVVTENGVVRLEGIARDPSELNRALLLARRAAHGRRVLDEVELIQPTEDGD